MNRISFICGIRNEHHNTELRMRLNIIIVYLYITRTYTPCVSDRERNSLVTNPSKEACLSWF